MARDHTPAQLEGRIRDAIGTGQLVDLRSGDQEEDNPIHGSKWAARRTVGAMVLADVLSPSAPSGRRPRALRLAGARVEGELNLEALELAFPITLVGCSFAEPVNVAEASVPALRLPGCYLPSLNARQLNTRGDVELHETFAVEGEVNLLGAHIGGALDLDGATLTNPGGRALSADGLIVDQGMLCGEGFSAQGKVSLPGAQIGGHLNLNRASLINPNNEALNADGCTVNEGIFSGEGFTAHGEVILVRAHIGGQLSLNGATLMNPGALALNAEGLVVDRSILGSREFIARGEIHLRNARIGGNLDLNGATLINPGAYALNGEGLAVRRNVLCSHGFSAEGELNLHGAHIEGQLAFERAKLDSRDRPALNLQELQAMALFLRNLQAQPQQIDLRGAKVDRLVDDPTSWPRQLYLRGFEYGSLEEQPPVHVRQRLQWLRRDPEGWIPQPYEQLIAAYRSAGRDQNARTVAIAKRRGHRRTLPLPAKAWSLLLDTLVGYGYRTWLAWLWLLGFVLIGWAVFARAHPAHLTPTRKAGEVGPAFHPLVYALDTVLPVVDLRQQDNWVPQGGARWWAWVSILAGWALTTAVVAALTGIAKRD
jgi:hypothetical protein